MSKEFQYSSIFFLGLLLILNACESAPKKQVNKNLFWRPVRSIEISENQVVIDEKKASAFKCLHKTQKKAVGKLQLEDQVFEVSCFDEYLGGTYLNGENVAQQDADAGDSWGTHSLLFVNPENSKIIWWKRSFLVHDMSADCEGLSDEILLSEGLSKEQIKKCRNDEKVCKQNDFFQQWDSKTQKFKKLKVYEGPVPQRKLKPFKYFRLHCKS